MQNGTKPWSPVQSNPIQRAHAQAALLYDAPTMMELAESLPYTSPTSNTRARPSCRLSICLAAYPAFQPVTPAPVFSISTSCPPLSTTPSCSTNRQQASISHLRHPRSPLPSTNADEERLEHGLNGEVLPDPLPILSRPIDSCTVNEDRRKIICTCPNAIIVILCKFLSTLEPLPLCYAIDASLNRHGGSRDRIATCARG